MGEYPKMEHYKHEKCEMPKKHWHEEKDFCPDRVKGFNLCKKRNELRCFKHCQPISQPCDETPYSYFRSRTNFEFSGLVVVTNTVTASNCTMDVLVTDRAGTEQVATLNPGASFPIFVEGLINLQIRCNTPETPPAVAEDICSGEIIFDLEYCASKLC